MTRLLQIWVRRIRSWKACKSGCMGDNFPICRTIGMEKVPPESPFERSPAIRAGTNWCLSCLGHWDFDAGREATMFRAYHVDGDRTDWFGIGALCALALVLGGVFFGLREDR